MTRISFVLLLIFAAVGYAIGAEVLQIRNFKGLNTIAGDFAIQPNEARRAHNVDLGRNPGSLTKRYGYDSISTISGMDSIVNNGIYPAYYSDGTQQLVVVADSAGVSYGGVYLTQKGSSCLDADSLTKIWNYWGTHNPPSFTMWDDCVYIVNGSHKGMVWNGDVARSYPIRAPSEPTIVPLDGHGNGNINGEVRYLVLAKRDTVWDGNPFGGPYNDTLAEGVVSQPVKVANGSVMLTNFLWPTTDSLYNSYPDGIRYLIYRTTSNPGPLRITTEFYQTMSFKVPNADSANSYIYIDTCSDSLIQVHMQPYSQKSGGLLDLEMKGRDSTGGVFPRYGAPGFVSATITADSGVVNLFTGVPEQVDSLGVAYAVTFIDTATAIESDTGRSLFVFSPLAHPNDSVLKTVTINLPNPVDTGLVKNIYRALVRQLTYKDSTYEWEGGTSVGDAMFDREEYGHKWIDYLAVDTVVVDYYHLVGQVASGDTVFTDSISYDSLSTRRKYYKNAAPSLLNQIFTHNGKMFGLQGSRLFFSDLLWGADTIQTWGAMAFQSFNEDDGDIGTAVWPERTAIRFMKNFSNFNLYSDLSKREISGYYGCVAPLSHTAGLGGHYFLSSAGVLRETEGGELERTFNTELVSAPLRNFDDLSITTKKNAVAAYHNQKYMLSIGDTTYVYDERVDGWVTWDLTFGGTALYGTETDVNFIPGDTLYFFKPGDSTLCRYGTSEYDNYQAGVDSTNIPFYWYTGPLLASDQHVMIDKIGLWTKSEDAINAYYVQIFDQNDTSRGTEHFAPLTSRYSTQSFPVNQGNYFRIQSGSNIIVGNMNSTIIDGMDIYWTTVGAPPAK